jgi:hypothetical protein
MLYLYKHLLKNREEERSLFGYFGEFKQKFSQKTEKHSKKKEENIYSKGETE